MRSFFRGLSVAALVLIAAFPLLGSEAPDELALVQVALNHHLETSFPYVNGWVVGEETEPLKDGDFDLPTATCRAGEPLSLQTIRLANNAELAALTAFSTAGEFDWRAFEQAFGDGTWVASVARPCFVDDANAIVRIDVSARHKQRSLTSAIVLAKNTAGSWVVNTTRSR